MKKQDGERQDSTSKVAERLSWLSGRAVRVRLGFGDMDDGQRGEVFEGIYEDTAPMGREYFFVFKTNNGRRLIRTTCVVEIAEILGGK